MKPLNTYKKARVSAFASPVDGIFVATWSPRCRRSSSHEIYGPCYGRQAIGHFSRPVPALQGSMLGTNWARERFFWSLLLAFSEAKSINCEVGAICAQAWRRRPWRRLGTTEGALHRHFLPWVQPSASNCLHDQRAGKSPISASQSQILQEPQSAARAFHLGCGRVGTVSWSDEFYKPRVSSPVSHIHR